MKPCQMAGAQCPHEAVATIRVDTVGDRPLCGPHRDFVVGHGFGRELEPNAYKPEWTRRGLARDMTGRIVVAR